MIADKQTLGLKHRTLFPPLLRHVVFCAFQSIVCYEQLILEPSILLSQLFDFIVTCCVGGTCLHLSVFNDTVMWHIFVHITWEALIMYQVFGGRHLHNACLPERVPAIHFDVVVHAESGCEPDVLQRPSQATAAAVRALRCHLGFQA
ncbi:hypothetical protein H310_14405 [Aphanomyces invadans]|uniref:Uncharacterized protein n=1 Tax=Aphanomyces invadans TaxID=157072 RepID=A0A024TAB8_9STRA|nr:hypothetical protein H310_14405 [Aphanomyces invadans]ETV90919.1 hypothetical protein H310_14405 [Aphanomyces invadans]|eukprot:XP_008880484.1 hypothetical protein H310_14405 [Aphanomyces invadans]